jgi:hypothetical protein
MAGESWLLVHDETQRVDRIDKSPTVLGRGSECDIVYDTGSVSYQHLQFNVQGRTLVIHDLKSTNGTFYNGEPVNKITIKAPGQHPNQLRVGNVSMSLIYGSVETAAEPVTPDADSTDEPAKWFFASNGVERGPFRLSEVFEAVDRRELRPTDDFWEEGMGYRLKAFEVEGLFDQTDTSGVLAEAVERISANALICPYCWNRFHPEDILFVAGHPDLMGDPVLGRDEPQRFLPTRFTPEGLAIDAGGVLCPDMACPTCHMRLPAAATSQPPLFMSIVGAPGSGKSYYLASAVWTLRTTLPRHFGIRFMDVDAATNQWLNDYEEKLFFQSDDQGYQAISKTDMQAPSVYRQVLMNSMQVSLPLPSMFTLRAGESKGAEPGIALNRTLVLYDNAGEHFQAGADSAATPGTKHLVHAEGILFLFDPTEDPRFRPALARRSHAGALSSRMHRQDVLLTEMIGRIRKYLGTRSGERLSKTVIVGISKADLLSDYLPMDSDPWRTSPSPGGAVLDMKVIAEMSGAARSLMEQFAPEIVETVESFSESVLYLPNSALGHHPSKEGVRPGDIRPKWVEVPILCILSRLGYVRAAQNS